MSCNIGKDTQKEMATVDSLKICTFNANGLGHYQKRKDVFDYLRQQKASIYLLQETHLKTDMENVVRSMWGFECFLCGNDTNSKGVAILMNNNFEYKVHGVIRSDDGNYIMLDIEMAGKRITLANIYGPSNSDSPAFFTKVSEEIDRVDNEYCVIGGDWNVVVDVNKDTFRYRSINRPRSLKKVHEIMDTYCLVDVWRELHPQKKMYTWRRFNSTQQARLDYFLVSESLVLEMVSAEIKSSYRSDHAMVYIELPLQSRQKHSTFWKFNNSLLKDKTYVDIIKNTILELKKQYCVKVYDMDNIANVGNDEIQFVINDQTFFEMVLLEIRGRTISYASYKKKKETEKENLLKREISELEKKVDENNLQTLEMKKEQLQDLRKTKTEGMIVRSRAKWIQEGEKPSRYFCSLESRNFTQKAMNYIETDDGKVIYDQQSIVKEAQSFYEQLYASKEADVVNVDLSAMFNAPTLSEEDRSSIEGLISVEEALCALKHMNNNKSPGSDGFTTEFYKFFWIDVGHFLVRSVNYGFATGEMSVTQKQGVITCIPKEDKPKKYLKNWRPITLLNTAYKLASACISERLKRVLPTIINDDQKGFLKGRYIGENIRLMYDVLMYTQLHQRPGLLLLVDFQKAFDSVAWSFLEKCLDFFNFGPDMKRWVKTFYNNISACVSVNGHYSNWFPVERGCRQGDSCSPYLYLICAEVLSLIIRKNKDIKGIKINDIEVLLSQFADDTSLYLDGSKKSFMESIRSLQYFSTISGLQMNMDKTQVIWIGSRKNSQIRYMPEFNFVWDPGIFKVLGIKFSTDISTIVDINFEGKLNDIQRTLNIWYKRQLTPFGKITVIKTLAMSKIVHLLTNLPDPPTQFMTDLNKMFFTFLWDGKRGKINKSATCSSHESGGLQMLDIHSFLTSLKVSWIRRLFITESLIRKLLIASCPTFDNLRVYGGEYCNIVIQQCENKFWVDVVKHFKKVCDKCLPETFSEFLSECLHYNKSVVRDRKTVHVQEWMDKGVITIEDVTDQNGEFLSFESFKEIHHDIATNFLVYSGIINAVKAYQKAVNIESEENCTGSGNKSWSLIMKRPKNVYSVLVKPKLSPACILKWSQEFVNLPNWKHIFLKCKKTTPDSQLKWFQFRLLHRLLPTKRFLYVRKLADSSACTFCSREEETISHLFWECQHTHKFWTDVNKWLNDNCVTCAGMVLTKTLIIFGVESNFKTDCVFDLLILMAKFHVYKCRLQEKIPNLRSFINIVKHRYLVEKYRHGISGSMGKFTVDWLPYRPLVL